MLKTWKSAKAIARVCFLAVCFFTTIYAAVETSLTQVASTKYQDQDIKFQGTALREELGPGVAWWIVSVDRIISGPQPCQSQLQVLVGGGVLEPGYVDPNIRQGDKVEVYGEYYVTRGGCGVFFPESYHYINKIIASTDRNLRVQVYDSVTGRMLSGAVIYIDSDPIPKGATDSNGEVTISIPEGSHTIRASNSGYEEGAWSGTVDHDMGIAIGLNPGVVRYRLRVQVYDTTTRRMLSGASLFVDKEASPCSMTDANGEATISVSQDVHTIRASKPGYAEGAWNGQIDKDMAIAISLDPAEQRWNTVIRGRIVGEPNYSSSSFSVLIKEVIDDPAHGDNVIVGNTITVYTDSEQLYQLQNGDNVEISAAWDTHLYCLPSKYSSDYIKKISGPVENHSPVPDFTWRPQEPGVGEIVHFTDTSYDPDNVVGHRAFAWNDGSSPNVIYDQKNPTHVFTKAGTYDVGLALWDESWDKTWQMTKPVTVLPEEEELSLTLFEPEIDGYTVKVNGVVKGASGSPKWDWGDGTPEEYHWFANTHTYKSAGTYTISVTGCNATGQCITKTKTVVIEFPGSFTGSGSSCACMSNAKIRCSLHYNNQLGEKAQILFLFTKGETRKVVRHELVEVGQGSGTAEVYFDCPGSEPGRYCISWRAYRKSDEHLENPVTWSKSYEEQEVVCPCGGTDKAELFFGSVSPKQGFTEREESWFEFSVGYHNPAGLPPQEAEVVVTGKGRDGEALPEQTFQLEQKQGEIVSGAMFSGSAQFTVAGEYVYFFRFVDSRGNEILLPDRGFLSLDLPSYSFKVSQFYEIQKNIDIHIQDNIYQGRFSEFESYISYPFGGNAPKPEIRCKSFMEVLSEIIGEGKLDQIVGDPEIVLQVEVVDEGLEMHPWIRAKMVNYNHPYVYYAPEFRPDPTYHLSRNVIFKVKDANGNPLSGADVWLGGTQDGCLDVALGELAGQLWDKIRDEAIERIAQVSIPAWASLATLPMTVHGLGSLYDACTGYWMHKGSTDETGTLVLELPIGLEAKVKAIISTDEGERSAEQRMEVVSLLAEPDQVVELIIDTGHGVGERPKARFTFSSQEPEVGEEVHFDASNSSDPDGFIAEYRWDFPDMVERWAVTGRTVNHNFQDDLTYRVCLRVTDDQGLTDEACNDVSVKVEQEIDAQITDLNIDYAEYKRGDTVKADVTVKNTGDITHNFYIGYSVRDRNGKWWDAPYKNLYLSSGDTGTVRLVWTVESDAPEGSHLARVTVWERESGGKLYGELDRREKPNAFTVKIPSDATPPSIPRLILPANGATLPNEPIKWTFNWSDSDDGNGSGVKGYQIYVIGPNARIPVVDTFVKESYYNHTSAGFIAGQNLNGWTWKVKAQDNAGNWSDWSEVQTFNVAGLGGSSPPVGPPLPQPTPSPTEQFQILDLGSYYNGSHTRYRQAFLTSEQLQFNGIPFRVRLSGNNAVHTTVEGRETIQIGVHQGGVKNVYILGFGTYLAESFGHKHLYCDDMNHFSFRIGYTDNSIREEFPVDVELGRKEWADILRSDGAVAGFDGAFLHLFRIPTDPNKTIDYIAMVDKHQKGEYVIFAATLERRS